MLYVLHKFAGFAIVVTTQIVFEIVLDFPEFVQAMKWFSICPSNGKVFL